MSTALSWIDTAILALLGVHSVSTRKSLSKQINRVSVKLVQQWFHHRSLTANPDAIPPKTDGGSSV